jgi:hypothetical protein
MNSYFTSSDYIVSSLITEGKEQKKNKEISIEMPQEVAYINTGYQYSIELKRNDIRKKLSEYFEFQDDMDMLDFIASNNDVMQILPYLAKHIITSLSNINKLSIYLLNESKSWKTLFINIYTDASWEETNKFSENLLNSLSEFNPSVFEKVNFNFYQE